MDHLYRGELPGQAEVFAPTGLEEFMEAHIRVFPQEEEGIRTFFGLRRQMFLEAAQLPMTLAPAELQAAIGEVPDAVQVPAGQRCWTCSTSSSTDPKLKALCSALWPYMGSPPDRLSFFAYAQFLGVLDGRALLRPGQLPEPRRRVRARLGARRRASWSLNAAVATDPTSRRARSPACARQRARGAGARWSISNADVRHTFEDLIGAGAPAQGAFVAPLQPDEALDVGVRGLRASATQDLLALDPAHETFVYNHWDHEDTWKDIQEGKPGGMSMSIMTLVDPTWRRPASTRSSSPRSRQWDIGRPWDEVKDAYQEDLLAQFEPHFPACARTSSS